VPASHRIPRNYHIRQSGSIYFQLSRKAKCGNNNRSPRKPVDIDDGLRQHARQMQSSVVLRSRGGGSPERLYLSPFGLPRCLTKPTSRDLLPTIILSHLDPWSCLTLTSTAVSPSPAAIKSINQGYKCQNFIPSFSSCPPLPATAVTPNSGSSSSSQPYESGRRYRASVSVSAATRRACRVARLRTTGQHGFTKEDSQGDGALARRTVSYDTWNIWLVKSELTLPQSCRHQRYSSR
jgi:hypothetical protein